MDKYVKANAIISKFCNNFMSLKKALPIRPSEMGVLNIIVLRGEKYTSLRIAKLLEVSKPMVTAHICNLESKGYITREYLKDDKRSFYVLPTEKAIELVRAENSRVKRELDALKSNLGSKEYEKFLFLLSVANEIIKNMKE